MRKDEEVVYTFSFSFPLLSCCCRGPLAITVNTVFAHRIVLEIVLSVALIVRDIWSERQPGRAR